tara:strand:- start:85 stop:1398 length:1314 start_codon:yes stop_codon:yes gene_type:complete
MANEIEKTIEELEAEVLSELEEQAADAPKKGAAPAEPQLKASDASSVTPGGEVQDMGAAVTSPTDKSGPGTQAGKKAKEASGDAAQKKEGKPDSMDTPNDGNKKVAKPLAAGDQVEMEDDQEVIAEKEEVKEMDKMEMIKAMKDMETEMKDMPVEMVKATYDKMKEMMKKEMSQEDTEKEALKKEAVEQRIKEIDVQEHVDALMSGEGDLSEDFKKKAATVFESAVKSKVRDEVTRLQENYENEIEEGIKSNKSELTEKVDTYMNYVVEEWMKENELAIERGLKGEIAEDFIAGLKQLFEDHYVDIPDEKYDVLQAQSDKIAELEEKVNKTLEESINFKKSNDELTREKVISESTSDLADTEIEKFKELTEDVDFGNEEDFRSKLETLKESYFPKVKKETTENIDNVETGPAQDIDLSGSMAAYSKAIGTAVKGATK